MRGCSNQRACNCSSDCCSKEYRRNNEPTTGVCVIHRIVIAIAIQVQAVGGIGIQVGGIVGGDKSSPLGAVIPGVAVVETGVVIVVIAAITDGVGVGNGIVGGFAGNGAVAPGVVNVLRLQVATGITYILPSPAPAVKKKPPYKCIPAIEWC